MVGGVGGVSEVGWEVVNLSSRLDWLDNGGGQKRRDLACHARVSPRISRVLASTTASHHPCASHLGCSWHLHRPQRRRGCNALCVRMWWAQLFVVVLVVAMPQFLLVALRAPRQLLQLPLLDSTFLFP